MPANHTTLLIFVHIFVDIVFWSNGHLPEKQCRRKITDLIKSEPEQTSKMQSAGGRAFSLVN